jgi:hypothetical protein
MNKPSALMHKQKCILLLHYNLRLPNTVRFLDSTIMKRVCALWVSPPISSLSHVA